MFKLGEARQKQTGAKRYLNLQCISNKHFILEKPVASKLAFRNRSLLNIFWNYQVSDLLVLYGLGVRKGLVQFLAIRNDRVDAASAGIMYSVYMI